MKKWIFIICLSLCSCNSSAPKEAPPIYPSPTDATLEPLSQTSQYQNGSLFTAQSSLYGAHKNFKKGDVLSVLIIEQNDIQQDNEIELLRNSQTQTTIDPDGASVLGKIGGPIAAGLSSINGSRNSTHIGEATYQKTSSITDRIAVVVSEVREDGLLVVWGKRNITVDGEAKVLTISGVVDPQNITDQKTVHSNQIAMTNIQFKAKGTLTSTTEPGFGAKLFGWILNIFWPF